MPKMRIDRHIDGLSDSVQHVVEFRIYPSEWGPAEVDIYGLTPDATLTEDQEKAVVEYILENYEPTD